MNKCFKNIYLSIILILGAYSTLAQNPIPFHRIGTPQGLSQSTVFCAFQDSRGFLWFGTAEGLNRYDGYNFKVFRHVLNDNTSLSSNDIVTINEDGHGNIWVGTRTRGVSILNTKTLKFDNSLNNLKAVNTRYSAVNSIIRDNSNNIWFTTSGRGIFKQNFKTKKINKISLKIDELITSGFKDKKGNIWFGTNGMHLIKFENELKAKFFTIQKNTDKNNHYISGISEGASGKIYLTTNTFGLFVLDQAQNNIKNIFYRPNVSDGVNNMKSIACNDENTFYITSNDGLIVFYNEDISTIVEQKAAPSRRFAISTHALMSTLVDKNQNIWIGTWESGLNVNYKKQPSFSLLRHESGMSNGPLDRKITAVEATNFSIWLGTNFGLSEYNRKNQTWRHFNQNQLSGIDINSMKYDADGDLFISAYQKDLNIYTDRDKIFKKIKNPYLRKNSSISILAKENNGKIWVGTNSSGLFLYDKISNVFTPISTRFPQLNLNVGISAILHDNQNQLWVGTISNGIYKLNLNTNTYKKYSSSSKIGSLSDEHILSLHQDKNNNIWIGTNGGGLNLFNNSTESFTTLSETDGLPNNTIKSIVEDYQGNLWLSTNQGICNFNAETGKFKNYTEADGLQGKEFLRNVGTINFEGELFFGGSNGLTYFQPQELNRKPTNSPKIYFTDLKLFNKNVAINEKKSPLKEEISQLKEITLNHNQSVFTIEFLALDFQQLKNYQYAYKLEGFDNDWNYIGTQRNASYTNLHEGNYTFKVKATNNAGIWTENISNLNLTILPPWYRTIWAYIAYILAFSLSFYYWLNSIKIKERLQADIRIQKMEAKKIRELDAAKTNFFTNISHEFRTPLTLIISPIQQLLQNNTAGVSELSQQHNLILKNAQRLLRLINQILDISKIEAGNLKLEVSKNDIVEFLNSIAISFKTLAEKNNIDFQINIKNNNRYCYFDKDVIEKIVFNLLSNAFKFTTNFGEIALEAEVKNNHLFISVFDNGIGMDEETTSHIFERYFQAKGKKERKSIGTGIGLALTKELTELHLGHISVKSALNKGSQFMVEIPVAAHKFDITQIKENFDINLVPQPNYIQTSSHLPSEIILENDAPILLIVEDNDELREYLVGIFDNKYKILEAENGQIGLQKAIEHLPDIILSDFIMPIMDGGEFCVAIKKNEKTSHIPFIILTSKQNTAAINLGYDLGADDYILKPFNANILAKKLESILRTRSIFKQKFGKSVELIPENILQNETEEKFFTKAITIIENKISDPTFDVTALEGELSMSKMQLYRKLKGVSNLAPNEFIRNIRLKKAAQILSNTTLNISEIAYRVGFNDPAYFARCFRKEFGKAPTDYINRKVN